MRKRGNQHTVLDPQQKELLNSAYQRGQAGNRRTLADNISGISPLAFLTAWQGYAILGMNLNLRRLTSILKAWACFYKTMNLLPGWPNVLSRI